MTAEQADHLVQLVAFVAVVQVVAVCLGVFAFAYWQVVAR